MKRKQIGPTLSAQLQEFRQQMLSTPILQTVSANSVDLTDSVCRIFPISPSRNTFLNVSSSNMPLYRYCQLWLSILSLLHNASTKSRRCDFPELLRPMMMLIGLIVSKPAHSFLKQLCPLKCMESIFTMIFPSTRHFVGYGVSVEGSSIP